ncbi:hypothetical protein [Escherichia phage IMM-001]|nr:hypothetical protein [Escherichia phage IMM-001]
MCATLVLRARLAAVTVVQLLTTDLRSGNNAARYID